LRQFGLNDVTDIRPGLQDPFKMTTPSVKLFTSFSLGSHVLQRPKRWWVTQVNVNFLLVMEKKYTVFGVTFSFNFNQCVHVLVTVFSTNICIFVRPLPWWLLFNEHMNKACHYSLIVTQFPDRYMQEKDNEIVDSGSLKGDRVRYIQVTAICGST